MGNYPCIQLEVISSLNVFSQSIDTYYFAPNGIQQNYTPKIYLSTLSTIALGWIRDLGKTLPNSSTWPQSYQQVSQKG